MVSNTNVIWPNSLLVIPESEAGTLQQTHKHGLIPRGCRASHLLLVCSAFYVPETWHVQGEDEIVVI